MTEFQRRFNKRIKDELRMSREAAARDRVYAYLGPDRAMSQLYDRQIVFVDPMDEQLSAQIIARGYWEVWIEAAVSKMIAKGDRIVEVGANIGYHTLLMARQLGPTGRLDTFEANPRLADLLQTSVTFNGWADRTRVHAKAAGGAPGSLQFVMRRRSSGGGHVRAPGEGLGEGQDVVEVEVVCLDDVIEGKIDLLRIDAEGYEAQVLFGAKDLITRSPNVKICMEWDRVQLSAHGEPKALLDGLKSLGFSFWLIEYDAGLSPITPRALMNMPHCDIVAARSQPF